MLRLLAPLVAAGLTAACTAATTTSSGGSRSPADTEPTASASSEPAPSPTASPSPSASPTPTGPTRPAWLGTRVLPERPDGFGEIRPTPAELRDRRLPTVPLLPPPTSEGFEATVSPVPRDVLERSTWSPECPVAATDLRYLTLPFRGFDGERHTGELLVHADVVDDIVGAFGELHELHFPIEEMRIVSPVDLELPPTGDGNNTTAFVCRPITGSSAWSQHAYGRAVDVNPFHNPYVRDDLVLPELASAYADRSWQRPGMLLPGTPEVAAFTDRGWDWGGAWRSLTDPMHFSSRGG